MILTHGKGHVINRQMLQVSNVKVFKARES